MSHGSAKCQLAIPTKRLVWIIDCICGDDLEAFLHPGNLKRFEGWLVEPGSWAFASATV